ncbi:MAG: aminoacyl-tRNA hydrolase, partial [Candidatus Sumerlaeia bacterium]|nr:aminoacyl-tRNA hydrolase [Candidatus Sumerlaeia bacterium]
MRVIVGLGNPGKKYEKTPHNLGFAVIEALADHWCIKLNKSKTIPARLGEGSV